jgi:multiple sugar transport system permease protein
MASAAGVLEPRPATAPAPNRKPLRHHFVSGTSTGTRLLLVALLSLISIFPLAYMVSLSLQPTSEVLSFPPVLVPDHPTFLNYVQAWTENDFSGFFMNSVYVAIPTVVLSTFLSALTAYGFARYRFWGKDVLFYFLLSSLAVPAVILVLPQYLLMKDLGLLNSRMGLALLYTAGNIPFNTFLLRNFFQGVPRHLEEAMRLDGVREWGLLWRLIAPLSIPALVTVAMFTFNSSWDEYALAITMINTPARRTLPIALELFIGEHTTAWGPLFAATTIATIPHIIVFILAQRWFQEGMSVSVPT